MHETRTRLSTAVLAAAVVALAACGTVGGVADGGSRDEVIGTVVGEVVRVDVLDDEVLVREGGDRIVRVRYRADTPVLYQGREYTAENLEPGDEVRIDVDQDDGGTLHAVRIEVVRSVQERGIGGSPEPALDEVAGVVVRVERDELVLDDARGGTVRIATEPDTGVYYRGERYELGNLEPGDEVRVEVTRDQRGDLATDYVVVTRSRQEAGGGELPGGDAGEVDAYTGRVTWVEAARGRFGLDADRVGPLTVLMPFDPAPADRDAFERLATGDRIAFSAEWLGDQRVQLVRFDR